MNSNMLNSNNGPTMKDAVVIALILMLASYTTVFLQGWTFEMIEEEPVRFVYESGRFLASTFMTELVILAGLNEYTKKKTKKEEEG